MSMTIEFNECLAFLFEPARLKIGYGGRGAIYGILNLLDGKIYIGSAVNFKARWRQHKHNLLQNKHTNKHLQLAWNKDSDFAFEFIILEIVDIKADLKIKEQYWMDLTQSYNDKFGYNFLHIAGNSLGVKHSKETKLKISNSTKGKKKARKANKWIHPWGRKCPCLECKSKRLIDMRNWRASKNA